jgi:hypothetical protein
VVVGALVVVVVDASVVVVGLSDDVCVEMSVDLVAAAASAELASRSCRPAALTGDSNNIALPMVDKVRTEGMSDMG